MPGGRVVSSLHRFRPEAILDHRLEELDLASRRSIQDTRSWRQLATGWTGAPGTFQSKVRGRRARFPGSQRF